MPEALECDVQPTVVLPSSPALGLALLRCLRTLLPKHHECWLPNKRAPLNAFLALAKYLLEVQRRHDIPPTNCPRVVVCGPVTIPFWLVDCLYKSALSVTPLLLQLRHPPLLSDFMQCLQCESHPESRILSQSAITAKDYYHYLQHQMLNASGLLQGLLCQTAAEALHRAGVVDAEEKLGINAAVKDGVVQDEAALLIVMGDCYKRLEKTR